MVDFVRRFIVGALISIFGIVASNLWFNWETKKRFSEKSEREFKPVATIISASNDVTHRHVGKVVWQPAYVPENLGVGDAVRTSSSPDSRAKIRFLKAGIEISLDEDSITVIDQAVSNSSVDEHYTLDLIKGNALIQVTQDTKLDLKSGSQKLTLSSADVSISKQSDNTVDLSVLKGSAPSMEAGSAFRQNKFFSKLIPYQGTLVKVLESANKSVDFQWTPIGANPELFDVYIEIGTSRSELRKVGQQVAANSGKLTAPVFEGPVFWRLVAQNKKNPSDKVISITQKFTLNIQKAPRLAYPKNGEVISLANNKSDLEMRWVSDFKSHRLQIAKDDGFKNLVVPSAQVDSESFNWNQISTGEYFWRVIGDDLQMNKSLSSAIQSFKVVAKIELVSPKVNYPSDGQEVSLEQVQSQGLNFIWENTTGAESYKLKITKAIKPQDQIIFDGSVIGKTNYVQKDLTPGAYTWKLVSVDQKGLESNPPAQGKFTVESIPVVSWLDGKTNETQWYISKPTLKLNWKPPLKVKVYKYRFEAKSEDTGKSISGFSTKTDGELSVGAEGSFTTVVTALGEKGQILAKSLNRVIKLSFKALLPPPTFAARTPASINAKPDGSVEIQWNKVVGARSYTSYLKAHDGKVLRKDKFSVTQGKYKKLTPGNYLIALASVDEFGREGQTGPEKAINVPDVSDLQAPKVKLNVK